MNVSSGTGLPGLSRTNGRSTVVVVVTMANLSGCQIEKIDSVARIVQLVCFAVLIVLFIELF